MTTKHATAVVIACALLASGSPLQATSLVEPRFACNGMEPFWRLELDRGKARLEMPDAPARRLEGTTATLDQLGVRAFRGRFAGEGRDLVALIEERACTAPSGKNLEHRALVLLPEGDLLAGCCVAQPVASAAEAGEEGWARNLQDLLPAIDACLAAAPEPAAVLRAWPMDHGMAGVRLHDLLSRQWECVAPVTGGTVDQFGPAGDGPGGPPDPGNGPVFTRAPGAPPPGPCVEHEEITGSDGEVQGWLSFRVC